MSRRHPAWESPQSLPDDVDRDDWVPVEAANGSRCTFPQPTIIEIMNRRILLTLLAVLGAIPIATGVTAVVGGLSFSPDDTSGTAYLDSEYRFLGVWWTAAGVLLWWSLRVPQRRAAVTRALLGVMVLGGVARLLGVILAGPPPVPFRVSMAVELLVIPALLVWHCRVYPMVRPPAT
ncbi:DUF4345 domain-containing protein [Actinoplanes sp. NPDC020271]|uniref:DUF4345 domain-containing protein n=1 Tax=Actinoplanes sp. NPDC020271 TaxID=3363896 RepID=UPI0037AE9079